MRRTEEEIWREIYIKKANVKRTGERRRWRGRDNVRV